MLDGKRELNCNFLKDMQVTSVIPQPLIDRAKLKLLDKSTFFQ